MNDKNVMNMIEVIDDINKIDRDKWTVLIDRSSTATWFQTPDAYDFFASLSHVFISFVYGVTNEDELKGICVGYVTKDKNFFKQFFTRRAIINGGPMLADDINVDEINALLNAIKVGLKKKAIYIESRNLNDYSKWKNFFKLYGFEYISHLNFHVHTYLPWEEIEANIGKHRKKYIRLSFRDGAEVVEKPTIDQIEKFYEILKDLYKTKVHMPCFPFNFFEQLFKLNSSKFILVSYKGKIAGGGVYVTLSRKGIYEWFACGKDGVYKNIHTSSVIKYAGIKYAFDNGYNIFDMMGAGKPNEPYGVREFKAEFGGELVEHGRFLCACNKLLYEFGRLGIRCLKRK